MSWENRPIFQLSILERWQSVTCRVALGLALARSVWQTPRAVFLNCCRHHFFRHLEPHGVWPLEQWTQETFALLPLFCEWKFCHRKFRWALALWKKKEPEKQIFLLKIPPRNEINEMKRSFSLFVNFALFMLKTRNERESVECRSNLPIIHRKFSDKLAAFARLLWLLVKS